MTTRLFLALLALLPLSVFADETLNWRCWYDQQLHIECLMENLPEAGTVTAAKNLPDNLPAIVRQLRNNPELFRRTFVEIPLHSEPFDMEFTALLAKASMCGSRRDCTVNFTSTKPPATEIAALLNKEFSADRSAAPTALALADLD